MNISYDYYKFFYYIAKCGSFSQAANLLMCNQPNLTRAIKALEASLDCTLFIRSSKGVTLTDEGERLYENISIAIEHIIAGEERILASKKIDGGLVSIGVTEIALRCFLLPILNKYREKYKNVRIKIVNISTPQALVMLKSGLIDIAVLTTPVEASDTISKKDIMEFNEVAVCGERYKHLCRKESVTLSELARNPIVSLSSHTSTYEFYMSFFSQNGMVFSVDTEAATADQLLPLIKHNMGVGFVPEMFLCGTDSEGIYRIPLAEAMPSRCISLLKKRRHTLSLPARELERMICSDDA